MRRKGKNWTAAHLQIHISLRGKDVLPLKIYGFGPRHFAFVVRLEKERGKLDGGASPNPYIFEGKRPFPLKNIWVWAAKICCVIILKDGF